MRPYIDLHTHSTVSDGSLSPAALARAAAAAGITTLSLTDHDSTGGLEEAGAEAAGLGLEFIRGVELSSACPYAGGLVSVDVLGYYVPKDNQALEQRLERLRSARNTRNAGILKRLEEIGLPIKEEELLPQGTHVFGRPHIAGAMLRRGYVQGPREAFERYLGRGKPAYVPKEIFTPEEAVSLLASVGAGPFIAHPLLIPASEEWLEGLLRRLMPLGLAGVEVYHSAHDDSGISRLLKLTKKYALLACGGSDYHGAAKPMVELGRGRGRLRVPESVLLELKRARERGAYVP